MIACGQQEQAQSHGRIAAAGVKRIGFAQPVRRGIGAGVPGPEAEHSPGQRDRSPDFRDCPQQVGNREIDRSGTALACVNGQSEQSQSGRSGLGPELAAKDGGVAVVPSAVAESRGSGSPGCPPRRVDDGPGLPPPVPKWPWPWARPRSGCRRSRASRSAWGRALPRCRGRQDRRRRDCLPPRAARRRPVLAPGSAPSGPSRARSREPWPSTGWIAKGRFPASRCRFAATAASQPPAELGCPGSAAGIPPWQLQSPRQARAVGSADGPRSLR